MDGILKAKSGQAAMEYLMTYGWALLVIVIVIAILISLNIFSAPQGCTFERAGFGCGNPVLDTNGALFMPLTNGNSNNIKLVGVVCTDDKSQNAPPVPNAGRGYFGGLLIQKQTTYELSTVQSNQPLCTRNGAVFNGANGNTAGAEYSGKIWVFYTNEEDGTDYPVRTATANMVTKTVKGTATSDT